MQGHRDSADHRILDAVFLQARATRRTSLVRGARLLSVLITTPVERKSKRAIEFARLVEALLFFAAGEVARPRPAGVDIEIERGAGKLLERVEGLPEPGAEGSDRHA